METVNENVPYFKLHDQNQQLNKDISGPLHNSRANNSPRIEYKMSKVALFDASVDVGDTLDSEKWELGLYPAKKNKSRPFLNDILKDESGADSIPRPS